MTIREYAVLAGFGEYDDVTFIRCRAIKSKSAPGYDKAYFDCPMDKWIYWSGTTFVADCIVLNPNQPPIDWVSGFPFIGMFNSHQLRSLLVVSRDDLRLLYSGKQADDLEKYIDDKLRRSFKGVQGGA